MAIWQHNVDTTFLLVTRGTCTNIGVLLMRAVLVVWWCDVTCKPLVTLNHLLLININIHILLRFNLLNKLLSDGANRVKNAVWVFAYSTMLLFNVCSWKYLCQLSQIDIICYRQCTVCCMSQILVACYDKLTKLSCDYQLW